MAKVKLLKMVLQYITLLSLLKVSSGLEYSDLVTLEAACFPKDTCNSGGKGPRLDDSYDWKSRNCFCDDLCAEYGDCCLDAQAYVAEEQISYIDNYDCVSLKQFGSLYMKGKCLSDWEDQYIANKCTNTSMERSDPLAEMPVTSPDSSVTYVNYYCAICNNDSSNLEIWPSRLECPTLKEYQDKYKNLTTEFIRLNLAYDKNVGDWGLRIEEEGREKFHKCYIYPSMPETVIHLVRQCKPMTTNCSSNWTDDTIRDLCHSYTAVRYNFDQAYRNIHCVICNDLPQDITSCINESILTRAFFGNTFNSHSFAQLFDFSDRSGSNIVGTTSTCEEGEVYDPFFKKCRNVICGRKHQQYRFGRCVDIAPHNDVLVSTEAYTTSATTTAQLSQSTITTSPFSSTSDNFSSTTIPEISVPVTTSSPSQSMTLDSRSPLTHSDLDLTSVPSTSVTPLGSTDSSSSSTTASPVSPSTVDSLATSTTPKVTLAPSVNNSKFSEINVEGNGETITVENITFASKKANITFSIVESISNVSDSNYANETVGNSTADSPSNYANERFGNSTADFSSNYANETVGNKTVDTPKKPSQSCERFLLPKEEYTMNDNGTVVVEKYQRIYQINEYEASDGGILVCIVQNDTEKFSKIMGWVTLGGLGLSCVCLILHLLAFIIVPELRNLSGKNLASFCLVLLGAFSSFILSVFGEPAKTECLILASFMYYFFLASFCWVNVMAFDIWRTLSLATSELRVTSGKQCCKYMVYSIYGWLLPAAAVVGVVLLDAVRPPFLPPQYYPAFGEYWCWFGHRKALLVFFAAPLMAIMVLNITLFILSARIIANTMESTAKMTSCSPYQSQFKLYMRLALLMGLTWISGIVAGYLQVEAVWYIFVLLNTLQGFFIFLAFTCTRKVWHALRCMCCRRLNGLGSSWTGRRPSSSKQGLQSTSSNVSQLSNQSNSSPSTRFTSSHDNAI